jgi:CheY-like chemotaxis protein
VILPAVETALLDPSLAERPQTRRLLEDATHATRRAAQLVAQLMASAGQRAAAPRERVDLSKLLEAVVSMCRQTIDRQCALELTLEQPTAPVLGDAAALEQVFLNLILNARDALSERTRTTPSIQVELAVLGGATPCARVVVRDNGAGMSDVVKQRLFEPFFTTKLPGQGTGLGLATSRATIHSHGGSIEVSSQLGKGTACEVRLPLAAAQEPRPERASVANRARASRVLLVDDEPAIRSVVRQVLEAQGHEVVEAESGKQAVQQLEAGFDAQLVLLDRSMPGWPAWRAVSELRSRIPGVPIVFFTGQDVPANEAALVEEVLFKPLSLEDLQAVIDKWLSRD